MDRTRLVNLDRGYNSPVLGDIKLFLPDDVTSPPPLASHAPDNVCAYCGVAHSELLKCGRCRLVHYCCKEHQVAAWSAGHKSTCGKTPLTLVAVAQANAATLLGVLSEFGAAPAFDGLIQTALHRLGGVSDTSAVFMTDKGLNVLERILRKHAHNPDIIKRTCAVVGLVVHDSTATEWPFDGLAGRCLRVARAGVMDAMLEAIRAWQNHSSISWVGLHVLTLLTFVHDNPTVQHVLIEKGVLSLTVALLSERHHRTNEQHERVTLAGIYVLDRLVVWGKADKAASLVQAAGGKLVHLALVRSEALPLIKNVVTHATQLKDGQTAVEAVRLFHVLTWGYDSARAQPNVDYCEPEGCRAVDAAGGVRLVLDCLQAWTSKQLINRIDHAHLALECFGVLWHLQKSLGHTIVKEILDHPGSYTSVVKVMHKYATTRSDLGHHAFAMGGEVVVSACPPEAHHHLDQPPSPVFNKSAEALVAAGIIAVLMTALRSNATDADVVHSLTYVMSSLLRKSAALKQVLAPKGPRLVEAIGPAAAAHAADVRVQGNVCAIFSNLYADMEYFGLTDSTLKLSGAVLERVKDEVRTAVRPVCAAMIAHKKAEDVQSSGSRALQFFGAIGLGKAVAAAGGVQVLTRTLKSGPKPGRQQAGSNMMIQDETFGRATMALAQLSKSGEVVQAFIAAGGVPATIPRIDVDEPPVRCTALCTVLAHVAVKLEASQREELLPKLKAVLPKMRSFIDMEHLRDRHFEHEPGIKDTPATLTAQVLPEAKKAYRRLLGVAASCAQCGVQTTKPLGCEGCAGPLELDVTTWYCSKSCQRAHWPMHKLSCEFAAEAAIPKSSTSQEFSFGLPSDPAELAKYLSESGGIEKLSLSLSSIEKPKRPEPGTPQLPAESIVSADAMRAWVLNGGDVTLCDDKGHTLLFYALGCASNSSCNFELAQFLIDRGVPLNARAYDSGYTVLHRAIGLHSLPDPDLELQLQMIQLLLKNDIDVSTRDGITGATPLYQAAEGPLVQGKRTIRRQFDDPIVAALIDAGASPHLTGFAGSPPILVACMTLSLAAVRLLLQAGATPNDKALGMICEMSRETTIMPAAADGAKNRCGVAAAIKLLLEQFVPLTAEQLATATLLGRCVVIEGLKSRPEINGRHGNPILFNAKSIRYSVLLDGSGKELLSLKPSNLTALPFGDCGNFMRHAPTTGF